MSPDPRETSEIFPKGTNRSYALVELVRGQGPMLDRGPEDTEFSFPKLLLWELILGLGVSLMIFLFSLVKQAPLDEIANPLVTTDPAKAPWYFLGLQELLEHMHPTLAGVILPGLLITFLVALPYLDSAEGVGVWFTSRRGRRIAAGAAAYSLLVIPLYIVLDNRFSPRELLRHAAPQWVAQGLIPALLLLTLILLPLLVLWRLRVSRREMLIGLFTVLIVTAGVLTISGFLFRGPGFKLYAPWDMPNGYNPWADL